MKPNSVVLVLILILLPTVVIAGCTQNIMNVSDLLANPVYETTVTIQGEVSLLHEVLCTCFGLTSDDEALWVWYDTMYNATDGTQWPAVSVEGIENGDWVVVTGHLQEWWNPEISPDFWTMSITKTTPPE